MLIVMGEKSYIMCLPGSSDLLLTYCIMETHWGRMCSYQTGNRKCTDSDYVVQASSDKGSHGKSLERVTYKETVAREEGNVTKKKRRRRKY